MKHYQRILLNTKKPGVVTTPYRYFRMYITARNGPEAITIGEWELYDSSNINRARAGIASASDAGFGAASGANDGIIPVNLSQPRWQTNATGTQWIMIDLGALYSINRAVVYVDTSQIPNYATYSPNTWLFQGSTNTIAWSNILQVTGYTSAKWTEKRAHEWSFV